MRRQSTGLDTGWQAFSGGRSLTVQPIFASETSTTDRPKPGTRELSSSLKRACGSGAETRRATARAISAPTAVIASPTLPRTSFRAAIALLLIVSLTACAKFAAPPQLTPAGQIAFHAARVVHGVDTLYEFVISAEAAGIIPRNAAREIVTRIITVTAAVQELERVLRAGASAEAGTATLIASIREGLSEFDDALVPPSVQHLILPYVQVVLAALTVLEQL